MRQKRLLGLVLICLIFATFVSAQLPGVGRESADAALTARSEAADAFYGNVKNFIDTPVVKQFVGVVFGIWDADALTQLSGSFPSLFGLTKIAGLIIYFVAWLLFLVIFKDILEIATPFRYATLWLIAVGLVIVASQIKFILWISSWGIGIAATLGALSVWVFLFALIGGFIALLFGNQFLTRLALRLRMAREGMRSREGAAEVAHGVRALREVEREFER